MSWRCHVAHALSYQFCRFHQILENGKFLLVLFNQNRVSIYLEHFHAMNMAIWQDRPIKSLNREKLGKDVLFAFDETKRSLAVCASTKVILILFFENL
jgi:hypothetical protein